MIRLGHFVINHWAMIPSIHAQLHDALDPEIGPDKGRRWRIFRAILEYFHYELWNTWQMWKYVLFGK